MKVVVLYRPNTEYETKLMSYIREFKRQTQKDIDLVDLNTKEGTDMAKLYDIKQYPAFLAIDEHRHSFLNSWQGTTFPPINELSYFDTDSNSATRL